MCQSTLCLTTQLMTSRTMSFYCLSEGAMQLSKQALQDFVTWILSSTEIYRTNPLYHYCDVIMGSMASQITSLMSINSTVHSGADQRKHQGSALLAFVQGIHRRPVNSLHKWPVTRKMFPFDDVIMTSIIYSQQNKHNKPCAYILEYTEP